MFCGRPVWRKTFLISTPETKPSPSVSVCLNKLLNLRRSPELTHQGTASTLWTTALPVETGGGLAVPFKLGRADKEPGTWKQHHYVDEKIQRRFKFKKKLKIVYFPD